MGKLYYFPGCEPKPPLQELTPPPIINTWDVAPAPGPAASVAEEMAALDALSPGELAEVLGLVVPARPRPPPPPKPPAAPVEVYGDPYVTRPEGWELWMRDPPQHQLTAPSVEEEYDRAETMHNLYAAIEALPEGAFDRPFKTVIRHRLGLDGDNFGNPETLDRVGQRIGKSRSTVQQIEEQAERRYIRRTFADLEYGHCPRCGCALYDVRWWGIHPRICPIHGQGR